MASKFAREEEEYNYSCDSADESECGDVPAEDVEDHDTSRRGGPCSGLGQGTCDGCQKEKYLYTHTGVWMCNSQHTYCSECFEKSNCPEHRDPRKTWWRQISSFCDIL